MNLRWLAPRWRMLFSPTVPPGREAHDSVVASLTEASYLNSNYLALTIASSAIATFGLLENSPAVIIGAMIIAPLMSVIQACAYGAVGASLATFWRAAITLVLGVCASIIFSALLTWSVGLSGFGSEILSRTRPTLLDLGIVWLQVGLEHSPSCVRRSRALLQEPLLRSL